MIRTEELKGLTRDEVIDKLRGAGYKYHTDTPFTLGWELNDELTKAGLNGKTVRYITFEKDNDRYTLVDVWDHIPVVPITTEPGQEVKLLHKGKYLFDVGLR